ncbi:MAG TPA: flagellar export protein FliJ, partial [Magnetospirillaceae bacterium]|nr:flagellar export protein FliJ [Magnetospirillaceae bacterium]
EGRRGCRGGGGVKRFRFRLEKALEVREYRERQAEMKLAAAAGKCARLELALAENARAAWDAAQERFARCRDLSGMQASELYSRRLAAERERTMRTMALAEAERETVRQGYIEASRDAKLLSKLRERSETDYYRWANREETKEMDDLSRSGKNLGQSVQG